ncbi:MAG: MATE family efflux transporter [Clostridia bacterium]|nr:MATE family efflux transporter [Clostridia bacterium]
MTRDLTQGRPFKQLLLFSLPVLIGNLFQQMYGMVDTVIVGQYLGANAMAAVGATGSVNFFILGFVQGVTSGFAIRTAQAFGEGDEAQVCRSVRSCAILSIALTLIMTALSVPFLRPLFRLLQTPSDLIDHSVRYIQIICGGMFSAIFYNMISAILRALGDSRTPLIFLIVSAMLNIVLDILLIAVFGMGVDGAALATVISQTVSGCLCLAYGLKKCKYLHTSGVKGSITGEFLKEHIVLGLPMGLQFSITAIGSMMLQSAFNLFGTVGATAYAVACKVEGLSMQTGTALGVTMANYVGQNLGAKRYDRIRRGIRCAMIVAALASVLAFVINICLGESLMGLFFPGEMSVEVRDYAMQYLGFTTFFFPFLMFIFIFRNSLQALGEKAAPMLGGVIELFARVGVSAILPKFIGYAGACLAPCAAWMGAGLWTFARYMHIERRWRRLGMMKEGSDA